MSGPPPDYIDVAERITEFRTKHPDGSFQQVDVKFIDFAGKSWVVYTAAAYRTPDDARPGHGAAWEPVPGPTNFTRDSELQNAETSAWGRAIVAALAADTKRGVASANEVRNRQQSAPERAEQPQPTVEQPKPPPLTPQQEAVKTAVSALDDPQRATLKGLWEDAGLPLELNSLSGEQCEQAMKLVDKVAEVPF